MRTSSETATPNRVLRALLQAKGAERLHHAYIFSGPAGVGKLDTALDFTAEMLAGASLFGGADTAGTKERILRSGHPDCLWIRPDEGIIKVEQVRELPKALAYAPLEAEWRIVLIEDAHKLNPQAANAILKILEEPPARTIFVLVCPDPDLLLPTIRSRCQELRFFPLNQEAIRSRLAGEGIAPDLAVPASAYAEGSLVRARRFAGDEELREARKRCASALLTLWEACPRIPVDSLRLVEELAGDEALAEIALDSWHSLLRDLAVLSADTAAKLPLYHEEYRSRLTVLASRARSHLTELAALQGQVHRFRVRREANVNPRLALEALLTGLQLNFLANTAPSP